MKAVEIEVKVDSNLERLLKEEDLDFDLKITQDDPGPKCFSLEAIDGTFHQISGCYPLSNLLQCLAYAHQDHLETLTITQNDLYLNPVDQISKQIRTRYWKALTRTLDEKGIVELLEDSKKKKEQIKRIYVPSEDKDSFTQLQSVSKHHPYLHLEIIKLPKARTKDLYETLEKAPGLLSLKIDKNGRFAHPFVVPGGRFNELYGWDSYFIVLGLLEDGKIDLACSIFENLAYEVEYYGSVLNANRSYYLSRSNPPLLSSMACEILLRLPQDQEINRWAQRAIRTLILEYQLVWNHPSRKTSSGLNRYFGGYLKEPSEVEAGHFDAVYRSHALIHGCTLEDFREKYLKGEIKDESLDDYFMHDRAMRESGHDTTNRLVNCCADLNTVDLNSLLYKYERDISRLIECYCEGSFVDDEGNSQTTKKWQELAQLRSSLMHKLMWNEKNSLFYDYDYAKGKKTTYQSATSFYPLFAGLASENQARCLVEASLLRFEMQGGIVSTTEKSRGIVTAGNPQRQWDFPIGWAPHQILIWKGLLEYGYPSVARRLVYRWLYMLTTEAKNYNGVLLEKYDVVHSTHKISAEYGNEGMHLGLYPEGGFGWTNASYQVGLSYLSNQEREALRNLTPPEVLF
ncbi:MAG: Periplasmic trehalase [Chlamydiae bacterium]|nr:Periplasmic trehalase [Chlamydiota bacterium]